MVMFRSVCQFAVLMWLGTGSSLAAPSCPALLQHTLPRLQDEAPVNLCDFGGKVLLVVNTASRCGYTPQYAALETLHRRFSARGLVVLGFPSNDFGQQEPGSNDQIAAFCQNQFDVKFPMFARSVVRGGPQANPLYADLAQRSGVRPGWNFHKYLIGRDGQQVLSIPSAVDPLDPGLVKDIERLLASASSSK
jgi:glutathione peroxidase